VVRTWEQAVGRSEKTVDPAAATAALEKRDRLCEQTMQMFLPAHLSAEVFNLVPQTSILRRSLRCRWHRPKILPLISRGKFPRSFTDKGRVFVGQSVPVHVVPLK